MQQTVNYATTTYVVDMAGGMTQMISDGKYLFPELVEGNTNRIAQQHDTTTEYYLADALGSVRQLTNSGSDVVLVRSYDLYGNLIENNAKDGVTSAYGYTGEYTDSSGMVYLRARYYSPVQGRFVSKDVWEGVETNPLSYNYWVYVYNNPIIFIDPNGQFPYETNLAIFSTKGKTIKWDWNQTNTINNALLDIAQAYANAYNGEVLKRILDNCGPETDLIQHPTKKGASDVFLTLHGGKIEIIRQAMTKEYWGQATSSREIWIYNNTSAIDITNHPRFIVHEMGHVFEGALCGTLGVKKGRNTLGLYENGKYIYKDLWYRSGESELFGGFAGDYLNWQFSRDEGNERRGEIFADMFIGWVYNRWEKLKLDLDGHL